MNNKTLSYSATHFSAGRFCQVLKLYLRENARRFTLSVLTMFGCILVIFILLSLQSYYSEYNVPGDDWLWEQEASFSIPLLMVFSALSGTMMFSDFAGKSSRLNMLTLPALQSEKFLARFIVHVPLFIAVFFALVWVADIIRLLFVRSFLTKVTGFTGVLPADVLLSFSIYPTDPVTNTATTSQAACGIVAVYFMILLIGALYALGAVIFSKQAFIKSSVAYFIIGIVCVTAGIISGVIFDVKDIDFPDWMRNAANIGAIFATVILLLYLLIYARMRESEIVNRW